MSPSIGSRILPAAKIRAANGKASTFWPENDTPCLTNAEQIWMQLDEACLGQIPNGYGFSCAVAGCFAPRSNRPCSRLRKPVHQ